MRCLNKVMRNAVASGAAWEEELGEFLRNYRATPHTSTGIPPADLLFQRPSRTSRLPTTTTTPTPSTTRASDQNASLIQQAKEHERLVQEKMCERNDQDRKAKPHTHQVGDLVYLRNEKRRFKSDPIFESLPYKIETIKGTMCIINNGWRKLARHASLLKKRVDGDFWVLEHAPVPEIERVDPLPIVLPITTADDHVQTDEQPDEPEPLPQQQQQQQALDNTQFETAEESDGDNEYEPLVRTEALDEEQSDTDDSTQGEEAATPVMPTTTRPARTRRQPDRLGFTPKLPQRDVS
jgi:hypothetical protein